MTRPVFHCKQLFPPSRRHLYKSGITSIPNACKKRSSNGDFATNVQIKKSFSKMGGNGTQKKEKVEEPSNLSLTCNFVLVYACSLTRFSHSSAHHCSHIYTFFSPLTLRELWLLIWVEWYQLNVIICVVLDCSRVYMRMCVSDKNIPAIEHNGRTIEPLGLFFSFIFPYWCYTYGAWVRMSILNPIARFFATEEYMREGHRRTVH